MDRWISKAEAKAIQQELLSEEGGFSPYQLMEMAGQCLSPSPSDVVAVALLPFVRFLLNDPPSYTLPIVSISP